MTSSAAAIIPITLTVNGRTGLTLWAPPWEDEDGEEWHGFLGDGAKILLYPNAAELAAFIASGAENDLSDHPGWGQVLKSTPADLRPDAEDHYDLDAVYEWAGDEPDPVHVSALANVVDMVAKIADCCDDGALRRLVEDTPDYAELTDDEVSYQGKDGKKRWNELGDTIADSWERAINRVDSWLNWQGEFDEEDAEELEEEALWDRVGAQPIELVLGDTTYYTVRGEVLADATTNDTEVAFIGNGDGVAVFTEIADLAEYCRTAKGHRLMKLEWWNELADVTDDQEFTPADDARFDLNKPTQDAVGLARQLGEFCGLHDDVEVLDGPRVDRDDWRALIEEIESCFVEAD
jgi:hypothetical protein